MQCAGESPDASALALLLPTTSKEKVSLVVGGPRPCLNLNCSEALLC